MLAAPRLNVGNMLGSGSGQSRRNVGFSAHVGYVDRARGAEMLDYSLRALVRAGTLRLERSSRLALPQVQVPTRTHARCRLSFHRSPQAISARDMSISSGFPLQAAEMLKISSALRAEMLEHVGADQPPKCWKNMLNIRGEPYTWAWLLVKAPVTTANPRRYLAS